MINLLPVFESPVRRIHVHPHVIISSTPNKPGNHHRFAIEHWDKQQFDTMVTFMHLVDQALSESKRSHHFVFSNRPLSHDTSLSVAIHDHLDVIFHPDRPFQLPLLITRKALFKIVRSGIRKKIRPMSQWMESLLRVGCSAKIVNREDLLACSFDQSMGVGSKVVVPDRWMNRGGPCPKRSPVHWTVQHARRSLFSEKGYAKLSDVLPRDVFGRLHEVSLSDPKRLRVSLIQLPFHDAYLRVIAEGVLGQKLATETGLLNKSQVFSFPSSSSGSELLLFYVVCGNWWINGEWMEENQMMICSCLEGQRRILFEVSSSSPHSPLILMNRVTRSKKSLYC